MTTAGMRATYLRLMPEIAGCVGYAPTYENSLAILAGLGSNSDKPVIGEWQEIRSYANVICGD
jgi:hypothetical protein